MSSLVPAETRSASSRRRMISKLPFVAIDVPFQSSFDVLMDGGVEHAVHVENENQPSPNVRDAAKVSAGRPRHCFRGRLNGLRGNPHELARRIDDQSDLTT